ncbi:MAG TPA: hypothetical protein VF198_00960 [Vicinamibacterales bacterium]
MNALHTAFSGFIDYAGLFPPASLPLADVIRRYGEYRGGAHAWMLGRLILPLQAVSDAAALARDHGASPAARWPVSVLAGPADLEHAAAAIEQLRAPDAVLTVESVETSASDVDAIRRVASLLPDTVERFVEIPSDPDPAPLMQALADAGLSAKIRTGGTTADRFPDTASVARFLARAASAGVPLKATAGLHHAQRGVYALTYEPDSPSGTMHGFVNLTLAAALLAARRIDEELADACLDDDRPGVFKFGGRAGSWLNAVVTYGEFAEARRTLLRSVGSCSFEEPVDDVRRLAPS